MPKLPRTELCLLLLAGVCLLHAAWGQTSSTAAVRRVHVLESKNAVEIEVEASDRVVPQTRVLTGPDRLVVDFPNTVPGSQLRNQSVNRGEVKSVRVGLFQSNPPVTRVVLDLNSPQSYQIFPYGRTVIIKVTGAVQQGPVEVDDFPPPERPGLVSAAYAAGAGPRGVALPQQGLEVTFRNGLLSIRANKATLSEVLFAVHQRTGADIAIAAGAEQEKVVAELGPAPAPEVLASLLNGSTFNFLILSAPDNPRVLDRVILSQRGPGGGMPLPPMQTGDDGDIPGPQRAVTQSGITLAPDQQLPASQPEAKAPADENTPN
jgi:hypothetical protein